MKKTELSVHECCVLLSALVHYQRHGLMTRFEREIVEQLKKKMHNLVVNKK